MKIPRMLIFFSIVLLIYAIGNLYLYFKGYNAIPALKANRGIYAAVFFSLAFIFVLAKVLESRHSSVITDILNIIGGFWLAFMLYGFIFFILSDIVYLILKIFGVLDSGNSFLYRKWAFISTVTISVTLIFAGFINAVIPVVREYNIRIDKKAGELSSFRIAAVSDIHLGSIIRKRSMRKLSDMLDKMKPDLVLLLGDIVDGEIGPVLRGDLLSYFTCPKCAYGMLAISGNHEFIGGARKTLPYIQSKGIRLLNDELVTVNEGIQIIGRKDRSSTMYYGTPRKELTDIMKNADTTMPLILLDHQPYDLHEAENNGIDLQLSGHTHNGQMWPLNYIIKAMYELGYGYMKKGNSHFIVSSGYGLWGPRVRLGSRSEVLLINITFGK
ncbi:MAG TPA: metallophosphoesterase [Bacteroidales bacterium]|nr:metallophosphoesterase [Bacteroidales bacterium]